MDDLAIWMGTAPWNDCLDERPWLLLDERGNGVYGCFPISSHCYRGNAFLISETHINFAQTGLSHQSYIHYERIYELLGSDLRTRIGFLTGSLLDEFVKAAGI